MIIASALCVVFSNDTFAAVASGDSLYKLSILRGVRECYSLYAKSSINEEDYKNYLSIFDTGGDFEKGGSDDVWITTHVGNSQEGNSNENDSNMSCEQIFEGYKSSMKGLKSYYPNIGGASLADMGYKKVGESGSNASKYDEGHRVFITIDSGNIKNRSGNVKYNFRVEGGGIECFADDKKTSGLLFKSYSWPNLSCNGRIELFREGEGDLVFSIEINGNEVTTNFLGGEADLPWSNYAIDTLIKTGGATKEGTLIDDFQNGSFNQYLIEDLEKVLINQLGYEQPEIIISYSNSFAEKTGVYKPVGNLKNTADVMLYNLGVDSSLPNKTRTVHEHNAITYMWDVNYTYGLYYRYLQDVIAKHSDIKINTCSEDKGDEEGYFFKNTPTQWCRIQIPNDSMGVLDDVYSIIKGEDLAKGTFKEILDWLKSEDSYSGVSDDAYANTISDSSGNLLIGEDEEEAVCYANSGALGWIICPIIDGISSVGTAMWNFIEGNFLQLQAGELFSSDGGVRAVWEKFRDIANIIFIILFLVVIFSQLTGVGIDNYGIKKIMPRLIVIAILVNLSYLLSAIAVDLSNILGSGLNALFTSLAGELPTTISGIKVAGPSMGSTLAAIGIGGGGLLLFGILNPVGALTLGGVVLGVGLAVLGIVITIVFSLLFMFIILVIRDAGIVVLIAISPVAIVCYMLPNTEKMFKKWYEMLKALLIVYPICGAMIGAGRLAGNLLASIPDSPGMAVAGMIVNVLPFFLVPMLLKQSLHMVGNIGAKLSSVGKGMGKKTSSFAQNKITGSERMKDWSQYAQERKSGLRAERISKRLRERATDADGKVDLGRLSQRDRQKLLKADAARNSWTQRNAQASTGAYVVDDSTAKSRAEASLHAQELKAYQDQFAGASHDELLREANNASDWMGDGDASQRMSALIQAMESNGMENDIARMLEKNDVSGMSGVMQALAGSKNLVFSAYGKRGRGQSFKSFMTGDGDNSMAGYFREKGSAAIGKLDDKSLGMIAKHQDGASAQIMSTSQLVEAAARMDGDDAIKSVNNMLASRNDFAGKISGQQLAGFKNSTLETLAGNSSASSAVAKAYSDIAANQQLASTVNEEKQSKMLSAMNTNDLHGVASNPGLGTNNAMRVAAEQEYAQRTGLSIDHSAGGGSGSSAAGGVDTGNNNGTTTGVNVGGAGGGSGNVIPSGVGDTYNSGDHTFTRQENGRWVDENGNVMGGGFSARIDSNPAAQQQIQENARKNEIYTNMSDEKVVQLASNSVPEPGQQSIGTKRTGPSEAVIRSAQKEANRRGLEYASTGQTRLQSQVQNQPQGQQPRIQSQPRSINLGSGQASAQSSRRIVVPGNISNISTVAGSLGHNDSNAGRRNLNDRQMNKN
ncbi:hypothetical protein IJG22_00050 [Candidatus Saccharibacteria bacterium]|nr:hypothetical protein [Candidatus Saccharibacteria bacterium]